MSWQNLWVFLLFFVLAGALWWINKQKYKRGLYWVWPGWDFNLPRGIRGRLAFLPRLLQVLAMVFMLIALARPQSFSQKQMRHAEGIDMVVVLDTSLSMLIEDMEPHNRLEASKKIISEFIRARHSDRIGLVVFSGEAYTRVPPTLDYPVLLQSLAQVESSNSLKSGTSLGVSLAAGVARLKDSKAKTRAVIFLTDGENNTGSISPETALQIAKIYGIKIYSIGMGVDGVAKLPIVRKNFLGKEVKFYKPMHSKVNEKLLSTLATETGGKFWRATNTKDLKEVFDTINKLEKSKVEVQQYNLKHEHFQPWLIWAFVFYWAFVFLGNGFLRQSV